MEDFVKVTKEDIINNLINLKQLVFEVTDACNLRCKYCGYSELYEGYDERENLKLPFEHAKLVIDYLYDYWRKGGMKDATQAVVVSFYGGEPLMNMPFIEQVIDYLEKLPYVGKLFKYGMTTNAMLLDRYMDFLVEKKFQLFISLDGDEKGQSYRVDCAGQNSFERVCRNIELLRSKYPDYFRDYVGFNSVIHDRNGIEPTYRFIKDHFGKDPLLSPMNTAGVKGTKRKEFDGMYCGLSQSIKSASDPEALEDELFVRGPGVSRVLDYIRRYSGNVYNSYSDLLIDRTKLGRYPTGTCSPFAKKMFVTVKGRILQCERINHEFSLGRVTDKGIVLDLEQATEQHNANVFRYIGQCGKCAKGKNCQICLYEVAEMNDERVSCRNFTTRQELEKEKVADMEYLDRHPDVYKRILKYAVVRA